MKRFNSSKKSPVSVLIKRLRGFLLAKIGVHNKKIFAFVCVAPFLRGDFFIERRGKMGKKSFSRGILPGNKRGDYFCYWLSLWIFRRGERGAGKRWFTALGIVV